MAVSSGLLDIVGVFQRYTHLTPASHSGKQWQGACPFSDCSADDDGFVVWPELTSRGCHYYCRGCGRAGDVLSFVCTYGRMSRRKACDVLGISYDEIDSQDELTLPKMAPDDPPPHAWQQRATAFARETMECLWSDEGLPAREYLHQRGFTDESIHQAQLGYHKATCVEPAATWGMVDRPQIEKVWLPRGVVIPWFGEQCLWKLNIRRGAKDIELDIQQAKARKQKPHTRKYVEVQGSADNLYHCDALAPGRPALLLESELDVLAAMQAETQDIVSAVATGSVGRGHTPRVLCALAQTSRVLIGFDVDENGRGDDAAAWWLRTLPHAIRLRPWTHDVNEMLQQRQDIRTWVSLGLEMPTQTITIECKEEQPSKGSETPPIECKEEQPSKGSEMPPIECKEEQPSKGSETPPIECKEEQEEEPSLICSICGAEVEYYSPRGIAYCMSHWIEHTSREALIPLTSPQEIMALGEQWSEGYPAQLVIDLETTGLDPRKNKVVTIALGMPGQVTIIDMRGYYRSDPAHQQAWREALQQLLQRDAIWWIGHNLKFDWSFLAHQFGVRLEHVYDTMLVEKLLHVGDHVSASLLASAERYAIKVTKEERSWFIALDTRPSEWIAPLPEAQLAYIRQDIVVPYQLCELQQGAIEHHKLARVVKLEHQTLPAIAAMEVHGVCIDVERWQHILATRRQQKADLEVQIKQVLGEALAEAHPAQETLFGEIVRPLVNLNSSEHLMQAFRALGISVPAATKEELQDAEHQHSIIAQVLEWKTLEKFETSFGEKLLSYVTAEGRIHATFDQLGAVSGRVICREPNLQNIPKPLGKDDPADLRRCFVAPEGHTLLIADLSNIELRILAEVSGDATMLRFFAEGKDLHSETARLMFKLAEDIDPRVHLVNGKRARDIAKTINFGLAYGMGAKGLAQRVGVDLATAKRLMHTYFATYRAVATYLARSGKEGIAKGYAQSLSGRKRFFAEEELKARRGEAERSAKNHPIQGTNADILKSALVQLHHQLPIGVHVILTVHDEIVLECPDELVEDATRILKDAMVHACREYLKVVCVPEPDVLAGCYWRKE